MTMRAALETLILAGALALAGCGDNEDAPPPDEPGEPDEPDACQPVQMRTDLPWHGTNRETLTAWLDSRGCASEGFDAARRPLALFDWDNTVLKNDIGDAITFHFISHDLILQPPNQDWKQTSAYMTDAAAAALTAACGTDVPAGQPLPTSTNTACADEILSMYIDNKTRAGATAFTGHDYRRIEPTYAWTAQLLAGHTHAEVQQLALAAARPKLEAPIGTTQVVGTRTLNGWLRIYDQIADLIKAGKSRGYDVWVITASPEDVVRAVAPLAGVDPEHVVGIRSLTDGAGKLTYSFEGCGPVPDGQQSMITYIEGKRCWVNKVVFGDRTAAAIQRRADPRQVLGAGDADTDIEFMRDATYKLALNRQKRELMCFAYHNEGDSWRVNPMFIEPRPMQTSLYPCSTTACRRADGTPGPCLDERGMVIPDQSDRVY
jgi:phosphoserine phosphatase